jgi:acetyl-CoA carboxylase biotin carboxylase subunit
VIRSLLVANRGEIAVRIIRAARERGIRTIAVYSEPDRLALHVQEADEAYPIGPAPSAESYLRGDRLIEVAKSAGAEAIHPGYGFLAERAPFAQAVIDAGLVFVGPRAETIAAMGDKTEARRRMEEAGVPIVPGLTETVATPEEALAAAERLGFPVLLKAAAGGGGKGMRVVAEPDELPRALEAARREALGAFADDAVYVELYLDRPRHIEVQLLGDAQGNIVHLGERDCSIQRRHQKLIEEAPSPTLTHDERARMGQAAVQAAAAVGYLSAGTVEFLYQDGDFFFLEMNTRLQVEHPVTELVTGIDVVDWQLRIASGETLDFTQDDVVISGHAIECRVTAEDPMSGFLPSIGTIVELEVPAGAGVRWDGGIREGNEVSLHYDPLLAKLIVHGATREQAISRMRRALDDLVISGVDSSVPFHRRVMDEPDFVSGSFSIRYVEDHPDLLTDASSPQIARAAAVAAALLEDERRREGHAPRIGQPANVEMSTWRAMGRSRRARRR